MPNFAMPVFFISHGAPTFATEGGQLGPRLYALGRELPQVKAVLVVSPHWQSQGVQVMTTPQPTTVHDFGGFPAELYQLRYPAPGHPELAQHAAELLSDAGLPIQTDPQRGLDHGAWVPLLHLLPAANVPVFQVSMPRSLTTAQALHMGQALAPLRQMGVLVVGSGSMTHNLYDLHAPESPAQPYATAFADWVQAAVLAQATDQLVAYRSLAPHAERAHPTEEHFLPLLVACGAAQGQTAQVIDGGVTHGVLSMRSVVWGMGAGANSGVGADQAGA